MLTKCAKAIKPEEKLCVFEVQQLATHLVNPRTKSWKVVVAYKHRELMDMDTMYPPGWTHRKYFGARKAKDNPAKHARKDDIVDAVINEHERRNAEEEQMAEERRLGEEAAKEAAAREATRLETNRKIREEEAKAAEQLETELASSMETGENQPMMEA